MQINQVLASSAHPEDEKVACPREMAGKHDKNTKDFSQPQECRVCHFELQTYLKPCISAFWPCDNDLVFCCCLQQAKLRTARKASVNVSLNGSTAAVRRLLLFWPVDNSKRTVAQASSGVPTACASLPARLAGCFQMLRFRAQDGKPNRISKQRKSNG